MFPNAFFVDDGFRLLPQESLSLQYNACSTLMQLAKGRMQKRVSGNACILGTLIVVQHLNLTA